MIGREIGIEEMQSLMNRGFLVCENALDKTWVVQKIPTPTDPRIYCTGQDTTATFDTRQRAWEAAAEFAEVFDAEYAIEVKYDEGLGPKFKSLGTVVASSIEFAETVANRRAEEMFSGKKVKWQVRISPPTFSDIQ